MATSSPPGVSCLMAIEIKAEYKFVDISSEEIFSYPFLFMTGHGNVVFSKDDATRLRKYLENGGFLYIDDDYSLDKAVRREMKKVFPEKDFVELPFSHGIYNIMFDFSSGPPKTHKHDENPPRGFGIFVDTRLAVFYTFESNPSDGWPPLGRSRIPSATEGKNAEQFSDE